MILRNDERRRTVSVRCDLPAGDDFGRWPGPAAPPAGPLSSGSSPRSGRAGVRTGSDAWVPWPLRLHRESTPPRAQGFTGAFAPYLAHDQPCFVTTSGAPSPNASRPLAEARPRAGVGLRGRRTAQRPLSRVGQAPQATPSAARDRRHRRRGLRRRRRRGAEVAGERVAREDCTLESGRLQGTTLAEDESWRTQERT